MSDADMLPKRERVRLARAELLMYLASITESWKKQLRNEDPKVLPFEEWDVDDSFRVLGRTYNLTGTDLAKLCDELGGQLEARAERAGYADHLDPE